MTDFIRQLTGKDAKEYGLAAENLVNEANEILFQKLVKQDDFLFDYIKSKVSERIENACNENNYQNLLKFFKYHSSSYDSMIARVLYKYGKDGLFERIYNIFSEGNEQEKSYAVKYFCLVNKDLLTEYLPQFRNYMYSEFEPLSANIAELLSVLKDDISKNNAIEKLNSKDDFEKYDGVKFLINYQATDCIDKIIATMKTSAFAEHIAIQIPYLIPLEDLLDKDFDSAILVLCNIINAIPDIINLSAICDFNLYDTFNKIINKTLTSTSAVLLRHAKEKFAELCSNDEYTYDCDKNTKNELNDLYNLLKNLNDKKLESLLYDELFDESPFIFFALDYVSEPEELIALLDSENQTLILKILSILKEKGLLNSSLKNMALNNVQTDNIKKVINAL